MAKIEIEVPAGMTPAKMTELLVAFEARRVAGKASREVRAKALKDLVAIHADEFETLKAKYRPKA